MPLSYPYKQNEEDKEIPILTFVDETMTPFEQLPPDNDGTDSAADTEKKASDCSGSDAG